MLQKLRSRHTIDLPAEGFGRKRGILAVLGGLFALFVAIPFLLSPIASLLRLGATFTVVAVGAAVAALLFVLIVTGIRGKPGWNR